jgi:hypothetical protein
MKQAKTQRVLVGLAAGGALLCGLAAVTYWLSLVLDDGPKFIPNYDERTKMFKSVQRRPSNGKKWNPRQGENWIF